MRINVNDTKIGIGIGHVKIVVAALHSSWNDMISVAFRSLGVEKQWTNLCSMQVQAHPSRAQALSLSQSQSRQPLLRALPPGYRYVDLDPNKHAVMIDSLWVSGIKWVDKRRFLIS